MATVIQIRDVPDDVHEALVAAARAEGISLSRYARRELEHIARRNARVQHNAAVIRQVQHDVGVVIDRETIHTTLDDGRRP